MRIAVTGGIAEGKSTVLGMLADRGFSVESSDAVGRRVFERVDVQREVAGWLGTHPPVSREQVRAAVAADSELRRRLNALTHPLIRAEMRASPANFHEVPLLIEACLYGEYDEVWVVTCGPVEQRRRLLARLGDEAEVDRWLSAQLPTPVKAIFADVVLRTNASLERVGENVDAALAGAGLRFLAGS